jgi:heme-degrading monooxygenase HmoA
MIVVANRFRVAEGYEEEFVERFRNREGAIEGHDGFVRFELLTPAAGDTDTFVSMTYWESKADFEAWTESEDFADAHDSDVPRDMFEGRPELEVHEVSELVEPA